VIKTPPNLAPRKPPPVEPTQESGAGVPSVDEFVEGDTGSDEVTVRFKKKPKAVRERGTIERADGNVDARLSVYMDREMALRIRDYCWDTGTTMNSFARDVLEKAAKRLPGKQPLRNDSPVSQEGGGATPRRK
jgi:hypothetical protein